MPTPTKTSPCVGIRTCSDYSPFGVELDGRTVSGGYRYGFQNQEKDDEIKGEGNSINYTYRMHDPRLGRFFVIDPLTSKYPWNSSFSFSENRIIDSKEIDGLEPIVLNGMLIGYRVENGQGPIAIANDLNNPETQKKYGYSLITKVSYLDIVNSNPKKFNVVKNKYDINDSGFKKLDIQKGDVLSVSTIIKREKEIQKDNKLVLAQIEANINKIKIIKMEDSGPYMSENDIKIQQEAISDGYDGEPTSTGESLSVISVRLIAHQINEAHDRKEANKTKRIEALRQANNDLRKKLIVKNE